MAKITQVRFYEMCYFSGHLEMAKITQVRFLEWVILAPAMQSRSKQNKH